MKKSILSFAILAALFSCKEKDDANPSTSNNKAPKITLADGTNYARISAYYVGNSIYCNATASDEDGSISKIIFYANKVPFDTILNTDSLETDFWADPYTGTSASTVKFTAKAFDNKNVSTLSNELSIVFENAPQEEVIYYPQPVLIHDALEFTINK